MLMKVIVAAAAVAAAIARPDGVNSVEEQTKCDSPPESTAYIRLVSNELEYKVNNYAIYKCVEGYKIKGKTNDVTSWSLKCTNEPARGGWEELPDCAPITCGKPPEGENTESVEAELTLSYGENYTYTCDENCVSNDIMTTECLSNGDWSLILPPVCHCIGEHPQHFECGPPPDGINTEPIPPEYTMYYGDRWHYKCLEGFTTSDDLLTICLADGTFLLENPPNCTEISCGLLVDGVNTEPVPQDYELGYGDIWQYECLPGYVTDDELIVECTENSTILPPTCFAIKCSAPPEGTNTIALPDDVKDGLEYMQTYTYKCIDGFTTDDEICTVCLPNGNLSLPQPPICRRVTCPAPPEGYNTKSVPAHLVNGLSYLQTYTYECLDGHAPVTELCTVCLPNGTLSLLSPRCVEIFCDKPAEGTNTVRLPEYLNEGLPYLHIYTYTCLPGYHTDDELCTICQPNGTLSLPHPPVCHEEHIPPVGCVIPQGGNNIVTVPEGLTLKYLFSYTYSCLPGYSTDDQLNTTCLQDGRLSLQKPPNCYGITCDMPEEGTNTELVLLDGGLPYLHIYTYTCLPGYHTDDELCTICQPDGTLSLSHPPVCHEEYIPPAGCVIPQGGNNTITVPNGLTLKYLSSYTYSCLPGYSTDDQLNTTCLQDGRLSLQKPPNCYAVQCLCPPDGINTIPTHSNGVISLNYLDTYLYTCLPGYTTTDDVVTTCLSDGSLSLDFPPNCTKITCDKPGEGVNTMPVCTELDAGLPYLQTYTYTCLPGYHTDDELCTICQPNETLSLTHPPVCYAISCPSPPEGINTNPVNLNGRLRYLETYTYTCLPGYTTSDDSLTICTHEGQLSLECPPFCTPISCGTPPNGYKTVEVDNNLSLSYMQSYTYSCIQGYDTDSTLTTTCQADGTFSLHQPPHCFVIMCEAPECGYLTVPIQQDILLPYNSTFVYECMDGYEPHYPYVGNMVSRCRANSTWSLHPPPSCTKGCMMPQGVVRRIISPGTNCQTTYVYSDVLGYLPTQVDCSSGTSFDISTCQCEPTTPDFFCPVP